MQWVNTSLYLGIMRRTYPFLAQLIIEGGREDGVLHIVVGALPRDAHTPAEEQQCEKHRVNRRFLLYKAASNWAYSDGTAVYAQQEARGASGGGYLERRRNMSMLQNWYWSPM